jgi:hypothetical protein
MPKKSIEELLEQVRVQLKILIPEIIDLKTEVLKKVDEKLNTLNEIKTEIKNAAKQGIYEGLSESLKKTKVKIDNLWVLWVILGLQIFTFLFIWAISQRLEDTQKLLYYPLPPAKYITHDENQNTCYIFKGWYKDENGQWKSGEVAICSQQK